LARTAADLEHLAHHDPMTNLPNRTLLTERLAQSIALAQRARTELLVLYVDLDRFKVINDTRGHAAGDRVLAVTGQRIAEALRVGDTASRVGGDEFILVCATNGAAGEAARLASRLLAAIGEPIGIGDDDVSVGASIGISMYPADGISGEELIRKADSAMYAAKQSGRNLFRIYAPETHSTIIAEMDLETELHSAVTGGQIVVHYQPIVSLRTNRLIGAEALVRWQHPRRGLLHPGDFLAVAESHQLIGEIGRIVLDAVCAQIAALDTSVDPNFHISMNVLAGQLLAPGWVGQIAAALKAHGADPRRLQLELAENIVMSERNCVNAVLTELRKLGVSLSIDDFGTGYSSLASIRNFPLDTLKIDRSFIRGIATDAGDQAVAKTIIALAHNLGLNVVATGVETIEQIAALRDYGSDAFQGYLASRPMAAGEFASFVAGYGATVAGEGAVPEPRIGTCTDPPPGCENES
jgi:diguanylate cyclase (GGDEF)-like protein